MIIGIDASALSLKSTGTGRYINCLVEQLKYFDHEIKTFPSSFYKDKDHFEKGKGNFFIKKYRKVKRHYYRYPV